MLPPQVEKWNKPLAPLLGMLLFAQLWDEMLFDFTLDSYRHRRLNVLGFCSELIEAYESYEFGILSIRSIAPIRDELISSLENDSLIKNILGSEFSVLKKVLIEWNMKKPEKQITYAADAILKRVEPELQKQLTIQLENAVTKPNNKKDIIKFSGQLLTEIIRKGYSPNYVYYSLQNHFFKNRPITDLSELSMFLKLFDGVDKKYDVIFKMSVDAKALAKVSKEEYLHYADNLTAKFANKTFESNFLRNNANEIFIIAPNIETKDEYSARREGEDHVAFLSTLCGFLNHRVELYAEKDALVYEGNPPINVMLIKPPIRPTLMNADVPQDAFDNALGEVVVALSSENIDPKTLNRLGGALRAHIVGVNTKINESQFTNLWTALETVTNTTPERNTIQTLLERVVPLLCLKYFLKLVHELHSDIKKCVQSAFDKCCSNKKGETNIEFLIKIISIPEYQNLRDELYSACESNPLLRFRIFQFSEILTSPEQALKILKEHEQRIMWHLLRLYRARNLVIHAGGQHELIDLLTENVHYYFDHVIGEIMQRIREDNLNTSIDKIFSQYKWKYESYKNTLSILSNEQDTLKRAKCIVFGTS